MNHNCSDATGEGGLWGVIDGELPPGIELSRGGAFSGRPTTLGTFRFTVLVSSFDAFGPSSGGSDTRELTLTVVTAT